MKSCALDRRVFALGVSLMCVQVAFAQQDYPDRPIRLIVPYPPGASTTFTSRLVGERLTQVWGQNVIVDNRPGANTMIGTQLAVRSRPDGYTLLYIGSAVAGNHTLYKTPYDATKDIAPIAIVSGFETVLVVPPTLPVNTLQEFIALAKAKPGALNYATSSSGGATHIAAELFNTAAGIKTQQIPYKGGGPAVTDLMGGHVQFMMSAPVNIIGNVKNGRLHGIAVTGESRLSALPNVPTFAEAGLPLSFKNWQGIGAPAGVPRVIIEKISAEIGRLVALPETRAKLDAQGYEPFYKDPQQSAGILKADIAKYAKIIKEAGIKAE